MRKSIIVPMLVCLIGSGLQSFGQAMSNGTAANPTTNGHATSGAAIKDQKSTGPKVAAKAKHSGSTKRHASHVNDNYGSNAATGNNASNASAEPSTNKAARRSQPTKP